MLQSIVLVVGFLIFPAFLAVLVVLSLVDSYREKTRERSRVAASARRYSLSESHWAPVEPAISELELESSVEPQSTQEKTSTRPDLPLKSLFHAVLSLNFHGNPISSENRDEWLDARRWGVTATEAGKIVKLNGEPSVQRGRLLEQKLLNLAYVEYSSFQHGREREPVIAAWAQQEFGVTPNKFLFRGSNPLHLATPDGIADGFIAEIKTSVKDLTATSKMYRDQLQWQLHVTNSERVLLIVEDRHSFERGHLWIERNESRIATLAHHADLFLEELCERDIDKTGQMRWQFSIPTLPHTLGASPGVAPNALSNAPALVEAKEKVASKSVGVEALSAPRDTDPDLTMHLMRDALKLYTETGEKPRTRQSHRLVRVERFEWSKEELDDVLVGYAMGHSLECLSEGKVWSELQIAMDFSYKFLEIDSDAIDVVRSPDLQRLRERLTGRNISIYEGQWLPSAAEKSGLTQLELAWAWFSRQELDTRAEVFEFVEHQFSFNDILQLNFVCSCTGDLSQ